MALSVFRRLSQFIHHPIFVRSGIGLAVFVLLYGLLGYFVLPGIIKSQSEQLIAETLHRHASIGKVEVNPYTLSVTMRDLTVMEPQGEAVFAAFEALTIGLSSESVWRLAPVMREVRLTKPYLHLVRIEGQRYNIDDILAMVARRPPKPEPAQLAMYNIQIAGGRIDFDDRPAKASHTVADLKLGVPFISSLPSQVEVFVEPLLSAKVDGAPFLLKGRLLPFAEPRQALVELEADQFDLSRYLEYVPFRPGFKIASARLSMHMTASFQQPKGKAPALVLSGDAALRSVQITESGKPVLKLPELTVSVEQADVFGAHVELRRMAIQGLDAEATRDPQGQLNLLHWLPRLHVATPPARTAQKPAGTSAAKPLAHAAAQTVAQLTVPRITLGELAIRDAALRYIDQREASPTRAGVEKFDATLRRVMVDTTKKRVIIGEITSNRATFLVQHDKPTAAAVAAAAAPESDQPAPETKKAHFVISVGRAEFANWSARMEDRSLPRPVVTVLSPIKLSLQDLSSAPSARGRLKLQAAVNQSGQLDVSGTVGLSPLHAELALDLKAVEILPLQPYFTDRINLFITRASMSAKGVLQLGQDSDGALTGGFKGDATLNDWATVDKVSGNDFLRWKLLNISGVDARLQPLALTVDQIAIADFFARIIIEPNGRINLQDIVRGQPGERKSLTESARAAPATAVPATKVPARKVLPIKIRQITLQRGRVRFTDNVIRPNYTANLVDMRGVVSGLSSEAAGGARVDVRGRFSGAPLTVAGRINPLKGDFSMDIQAKVSDLELAPLSPYSIRYVGYGIKKGKLSFEVAYQIAHRKLTAQNRLIVDQLAFGEKVDSPGAANVPVHLAVALMRDRNGVIDISLPVTGSLDDPLFTVGSIIAKMTTNLVTKVVASPFALLGSLSGGGGEELSYLEFDPGRAVIPAAGEAKLQSLAKALLERPALKLDITGRTGAEAEREGLKRVIIERKLRALKAKDLAARGAAVQFSSVVVKPDEYPDLLARVYRDEKFPKPRNAIGLQKTLPVAEMEQLMMANTQVGDDDLLALGNQRSLAVKDWLIKNGQVPAERIYLLATKSAAMEEQNEHALASPSRADFSLQ